MIIFLVITSFVMYDSFLVSGHSHNFLSVSFSLKLTFRLNVFSNSIVDSIALNWHHIQVSLGSDLSNRAPTFDMDLSDMMNGEQPISYEEACKYFAQDPSQRSVTLIQLGFFFFLPIIPRKLSIYIVPSTPWKSSSGREIPGAFL